MIRISRPCAGSRCGVGEPDDFAVEQNQECRQAQRTRVTAKGSEGSMDKTGIEHPDIRQKRIDHRDNFGACLGKAQVSTKSVTMKKMSLSQGETVFA